MLALGLGGGCARSYLDIRTSEERGEIWINGRPTGVTQVRERIPGTGEIEVQWMDTLQPLARRRVTLTPPLLWNFPFDLIFEALIPIPPRWEVDVRLEAPRGDERGHRSTGLAGALARSLAPIWKGWRIEQALARSRNLAREFPPSGDS